MIKVAIWRLFLFFLVFYLVGNNNCCTFVGRKCGTGSQSSCIFIRYLNYILR